MKMVDVLYERNDIGFERGKFRVRGDSIELWPSYEEFAYRIEMWGDEIEQISIIKPLTAKFFKHSMKSISIRPSTL
jgi:excinuclease ABC subunit B